MIVPLDSWDTATCSESETFGYTALHVQDPTLDCVSCPSDYQLPTPKVTDLNHSSIPEHVRKGISSDVVKLEPEVSISTSSQLCQIHCIHHSLSLTSLIKNITNKCGFLGREEPPLSLPILL